MYLKMFWRVRLHFFYSLRFGSKINKENYCVHYEEIGKYYPNEFAIAFDKYYPKKNANVNVNVSNVPSFMSNGA